MQLINFSIAQLSWILRYWGYEDLCITEQNLLSSITYLTVMIVTAITEIHVHAAPMVYMHYGRLPCKNSGQSTFCTRYSLQVINDCAVLICGKLKELPYLPFSTRKGLQPYLEVLIHYFVLFTWNFMGQHQTYMDFQVFLEMGMHVQAVNTRPLFSPPIQPRDKARQLFT